MAERSSPYEMYPGENVWFKGMEKEPAVLAVAGTAGSFACLSPCSLLSWRRMHQARGIALRFSRPFRLFHEGTRVSGGARKRGCAAEKREERRGERKKKRSPGLFGS